MSQSDMHEHLSPTRFEMPVEIRVYVVALLNQTLAEGVDLRFHVKQAYWNVKGPEVFPLQSLFAALATELDAYTDQVAARITALGDTAQGTARLAVTQSTLAGYPSDLVGSSALVQALAERLAHYATMVRTHISHATDVEDAPTAHLYMDMARGIETRLGGLEAYLAR
jgi:starvation-inducible DNA-binding protein